MSPLWGEEEEEGSGERGVMGGEGRKERRREEGEEGRWVEREEWAKVTARR